MALVDKAHGLMLQEDLLSRSALDDAISAIKNCLHGYLIDQITQAPSGGGQRDWPEWPPAVACPISLAPASRRVSRSMA
jgi:hypothetical protein